MWDDDGVGFDPILQFLDVLLVMNDATLQDKLASSLPQRHSRLFVQKACEVYITALHCHNEAPRVYGAPLVQEMLQAGHNFGPGWSLGACAGFIEVRPVRQFMCDQELNGHHMPKSDGLVQDVVADWAFVLE